VNRKFREYLPYFKLDELRLPQTMDDKRTTGTNNLLPQKESQAAHEQKHQAAKTVLNT